MNIQFNEELDLIFSNPILFLLCALIAYLFITLIVRKITFGHLRRKIKEIERHAFRQAKKYYQKKAFFGWILYLLSLPVLVVLILQCSLPVIGKLPNGVLLGLLLALFFFSLINHLRLFFFSTLQAIKEDLDAHENE